jgi:hypothetical protein
MKENNLNYRNGKRFFELQKRIDRLHDVIDYRTKKGMNIDLLKNHKDINKLGRVWSF